MNDYFEGALTATGGQMYTNLKTIFPGGGWIATLPTDKTDKKSFADSLADWFKSYLTKVEGQLGENGRSYADSLLQKLNRLDDSPPVVSKSQIGSAVVNSLNGLFQTLDAKTIAAQPEMRDFRDACYSLGMGLVAVVENSAKAQAGPLSEDLNEIRLRDTAAAANELVGDLPKDLQFRSTDTPSSYFREIGCYDSPSVKIDLFLSNNTGSCAKEFLTNLQSYESNKAGRGEAMLNMATVLQNVLDQTTELAEGDKPEASTGGSACWNTRRNHPGGS